MTTNEGRGHFGRVGFVLAAAGSAVGLGNIWKFPYITYQNEGGSFVLVYLVAIALIGFPIMLAEIAIGRSTGRSVVGAFAELGRNAAGGKIWRGVGFIGVTVGFVLLSYYAVVAGWTVYYFGKCLKWSIQGFGPEAAATLGSDFGAFATNGPLQIGLHALFMGATIGVVALGVREGIERVTKMLMPVLIAILFLLCVVSMFTPGFSGAIAFLFHIGPITSDGFLEAVGHSFFTLSIGMGAMVTYGSYMQKSESIRKNAIVVCILDTLIALMACVIMFSIIFGVPELERAETFSRSAAILFTTLPRMFYEMPGGTLIAPVFYLLVGFAALTSTISLLEVVASYFVDERGWGRKKAALVSGGAIFAVGTLAALSLGGNEALSTWAPFGERNAGVFGTFDYLVSNWMLPVGGLLMAIFAGWVIDGELARRELEAGGPPFRGFGLWRFLLRYVCPVAIGWIIVAVIGGRSFT